LYALFCGSVWDIASNAEALLASVAADELLGHGPSLIE
jgi:hypothetical protein